jgi:hypothetical protein
MQMRERERNQRGKVLNVLCDGTVKNVYFVFSRILFHINDIPFPLYAVLEPRVPLSFPNPKA